MIRSCLLLVLLLFSAQAADVKKRNTFAFFGIGVQSMDYSADFTDKNGDKYRDDMRISGSMYYTGTGAKYNEDWSFSILAGSSFAAALSDTAALSNDKGKHVAHSGDLYLAEIFVHANYTLAPRQYLVMGLGYSNETIKRYLFDFDDLVISPVTETNTVAGVTELGYSFSNLFENSRFYYDLSLTLTLPVVAYTGEFYAADTFKESEDFNFTYGIGILPRILFGYALTKEWGLTVMSSYYYRYYFTPSALQFQTVTLRSDNNTLRRIRASLIINWRF